MNDLRRVERDSIQDFMRRSAQDGHIRGRTLDLGCGHQPYRGTITAYGTEVEYHGYDRPTFGGTLGITVGDDGLLARSWDTIVSTQVIQYVDGPLGFLEGVRIRLREGGTLVMTGPTNWPVVESADRWRFTPAGIGVLLSEVGFTDVTVHERAEWEGWLLGWGAIAKP